MHAPSSWCSTCYIYYRVRESHSGLLFKLNSFGVGGNVLSICRDFLSNREQSVVVDGATSEWNKIGSGATEKCFGSSSVHPLYQRNV